MSDTLDDLLLRVENEGTQVPKAIVTDDHKRHIYSHAFHLGQHPEALHLIDHIKEHADLLRYAIENNIPIISAHNVVRFVVDEDGD